MRLRVNRMPSHACPGCRTPVPFGRLWSTKEAAWRCSACSARLRTAPGPLSNVVVPLAVGSAFLMMRWQGSFIVGSVVAFVLAAVGSVFSRNVILDGTPG